RQEVVQVVSARACLPRPLKIGIGGPVGSGKTALTEALCLRLRDAFDMAVITNDIYTKEDAEFLVRRGALPAARVVGVETGGCPHTAIREDASANLEAVHDLQKRFPGLELLLIESGGDNLAATFSPELGDARRMRGDRPFVFTNLRTGEGVETILTWIRHELLLDAAKA